MPDETKRGPGRPRNVILGEAETYSIVSAMPRVP